MQKSNFQAPIQYTEILAEETGIHIGDGFMNIYPKINHNSYVYSGHAQDDLRFSQYVQQLMKLLYNLSPSYKRIQKNCIMLIYTRKPLVLFKKELGLPLGAKQNIKIPKWILNNQKYKIACVRGIFATDGCLLFQKKNKDYAYYPQLKITSKSKELIEQIHNILQEISIKSSISKDKIRKRKPNPTWNVYMYGQINLKKFVERIGFINSKHQIKYKKWRWRDLNSRP